MKYICPVCGYPELTEPPRNENGNPPFEMCDCCGVEFGYEDCSIDSIIQYRTEWIKNGCNWFAVEKPLDWLFEEQLGKLHHNCQVYCILAPDAQKAWC